MLDEEDISPRKRARLERPAMDGWSIEELESYIAELKAEISRAEGTIAGKKGARGQADGFFRTP